jgi:hypothetical protein
MSEEEKAGHNLSHSNILIPHCARIGVNIFSNIKDRIHSRYICYKTTYIALLTSVSAGSQVLTYLPSVALWQKNHAMLDKEMDVKMEGDLIFGRD